MTSFDKIFTKSDLSENAKKSKMLFGRLLINLRKNNHIKLYSLLGAVGSTDIQEGYFEINFAEKTSYDLINNRGDIEALEGELRLLGEELKVRLICDAKEPFNKFNFEKFLRDEFGKILTIK